MSDHSHSGQHSHSHASPGAGAKYVGRLGIAFGIIVAFLIVQLVVAIATGSLALLSDAGHMLTDALGFGLALAAIIVASRTRQ